MSLSKQELEQFLYQARKEVNSKKEEILNRYPYNTAQEISVALSITLAELENLRLNKKVLGLPLSDNSIIYPTWQFEQLDTSERILNLKVPATQQNFPEFKTINGLNDCLVYFSDPSIAVAEALYSKIDLIEFDDYTLRETGLDMKHSIKDALLKGFTEHAIKISRYLYNHQ